MDELDAADGRGKGGPRHLIHLPFPPTVFFTYRRVEQLVACLAHNQKVAGSSPAPAILERNER